MKLDPKDEKALMMDLWSPTITDNPLKFVLYAFPWGQAGTPLEKFSGPRKWQRQVLEDIAKAVANNKYMESQGFDPKVFQKAVASGRGIGKSALVSWLVLWQMSCHVGSTVTVTANTESQLKSKTWAELGKWHTMSVNAHWFDRTALSLRPAAWYEEALKRDLKLDTGYYYAQALLWSEENPDAFAGTHNYYGQMLLFDEACHDDKTEVLTEDGWKFWKDVTTNDALLTMHPQTHVASYQKPEAVYEIPYKGEMYECAARGINFCVSPKHEMFYTTAKLKGAAWKKIQIQDVAESSIYLPTTFDWEAPSVPTYTVPAVETARKSHDAKIVNMDLWLEFLGWYFSEGSLQFQNDIPTAVTITQNDTKVIDRLEYIAGELGYISKVYKYDYSNTTSIAIHHGGLAKYLLSYGRGQLVRRLPRYIPKLSKAQIRIFLDAYRDGDGYINNGREIIYTSCEGMAGDLQELYQKLGHRTSVMKRPLKKSWVVDHWATPVATGYVVAAGALGTRAKIMKSKLKKVNYSGNIYCASVPPNELLFTRRRGVCVWSGNSGIPPGIWKVSEGFFTEPIVHRYWFCFSNPRRNTGEFFECFHKYRKYWSTTSIDSRTVEGVDVAQLQGIIDKHGIDSSEAKVEVLGLFPDQGDRQFISRDLVNNAQDRELTKDPHAALMMGVDIARFGEDSTVIRFRRGRDARSIPPLELKSKDNMEVANICAELIQNYNPDAVCIDAGNGTGVIDRLREMGFKVHEVWFGSKSSESQWANKRIELWGKMRDWLGGGCIDRSPNLAADLVGPEYKFKGHGDQLMLESKEEMKKRGLASPDHGDALAVTFAVRVASKDLTSNSRSRRMPKFAKDMDYNII